MQPSEENFWSQMLNGVQSLSEKIPIISQRTFYRVAAAIAHWSKIDLKCGEVTD